MRIIILFFMVVSLFANEINNTELNITDVNYSEMNNTEFNNTELNQTDTNQTDLNKSNNIILLNLQEPIEENITYDIVDSEEYNIDIAVILDKNKFFKFIPNILNSINAYMIKKDINYKITLFDKEENLTKQLNKIAPNNKYIFAYFTNSEDVKVLNDYPDNYFFIPTLNKAQVSYQTNENIFFGGINYTNQIENLNKYINGYTMIISEDSDLSKYITTIIDNILQEPHTIKKYPIKYTQEYNNTFVYLNTKLVDTAQILSNFTYKQIETNAILTTQIDYSPLIFSLTNPEDVKNLIIANSIFNISPQIEDNNLNLNVNIDFNWLDFTTSTLLNIAYNLEVDEDIHFLNDFNLYMFFNQVNYKTNLYKIFQNGFIKIEN